jgi:hypothetical protein
LRQLRAVTGAEETIVAHFHKALGEDMLQKAADELQGWQLTGLGFPGVGVFVKKGNAAVRQLDDALIADRHPKYIWSEIFQNG